MMRDLTRHWREQRGGRSQEGYSEQQLVHMYFTDPCGSGSEGRVQKREEEKVGDSSSLVLSCRRVCGAPCQRNTLVATVWENFLAQIRSRDTACLSFA